MKAKLKTYARVAGRRALLGTNCSHGRTSRMRKGFRLKRNGQVIADGGEIEGWDSGT